MAQAVAARPSARTAPASSRAGFTLIEMLVSLAILALLATIALPVAEVQMQRVREQELQRNLREIRTAIDTYKHAYDTGRMLHLVGASGYPPTLATLVDGVEDARDPEKHKIYFMRRIPRNPMVHDPQVADADTWGKRSYASPPEAPSEGQDVYDVYCVSTVLGLNGLPYNRW